MTEQELRRKEYEKIRERRVQLESLLKHPGWEVMHTGLSTQIAAKSHAIHNTAASMDGAFEIFQLRGQVDGLKLALNLPLWLIKDCLTDEAGLLTLEEEEASNQGEKDE